MGSILVYLDTVKGTNVMDLRLDTPQVCQLVQRSESIVREGAPLLTSYHHKHLLKPASLLVYMTDSVR